jgi:hypothetical protein
VVVAVSAAVVCEPLAARVPLQPPPAVHAVALVELQVSVEAAPLATEVGDAVSVAVGVGAVTVTVVDTDGLVPPDPEQLRE